MPEIKPVGGHGPEGFDIIAIAGRAYGKYRVLRAGPETHFAIGDVTMCRQVLPGYPSDGEEGGLAQVNCKFCCELMLKRNLRMTWVTLT